MNDRYRIEADGEVVWRGSVPPSDEVVNAVARNASREGWNGTVLDLYFAGSFERELYPDFELA